MAHDRLNFIAFDMKVLSFREFDISSNDTLVSA
jgi:hypothetical protein